MNQSKHISDDQLAKLRAGLINNDHEDYQLIEDHLKICNECSDRVMQLERISDTALPQLDDAWLKVQLDQRRRDAYENARNRPGWFKTYGRGVVALGVILAIGQSAIVFNQKSSVDSQIESLVDGDIQDEEELFTAMEFYIWLSEQDLDDKG